MSSSTTTTEDCDVTCPRCGRISFSVLETKRLCPECSWVIRPQPVDEPYGYDVLVEIRSGPMGTAQVERHYKGNETTARRRARSVHNYERVLAVVPLSQEAWVRAYGDGYEQWG